MKWYRDKCLRDSSPQDLFSWRNVVVIHRHRVLNLHLLLLQSKLKSTHRPWLDKTWQISDISYDKLRIWNTTKIVEIVEHLLHQKRNQKITLQKRDIWEICSKQGWSRISIKGRHKNMIFNLKFCIFDI